MVNGSGSCGVAPGTHGRSGVFAFQRWICESTISRRRAGCCAGAGAAARVVSANPAPSVAVRNSTA